MTDCVVSSDRPYHIHNLLTIARLETSALGGTSVSIFMHLFLSLTPPRFPGMAPLGHIVFTFTFIVHRVLVLVVAVTLFAPITIRDNFPRPPYASACLGSISLPRICLCCCRRGQGLFSARPRRIALLRVRLEVIVFCGNIKPSIRIMVATPILQILFD